MAWSKQMSALAWRSVSNQNWNCCFKIRRRNMQSEEPWYRTHQRQKSFLSCLESALMRPSCSHLSSPCRAEKGMERNLLYLIKYKDLNWTRLERSASSQNWKWSLDITKRRNGARREKSFHFSLGRVIIESSCSCCNHPATHARERARKRRLTMNC